MRKLAALLSSAFMIALISTTTSADSMRNSCIFDKYFSVCLENNNIFPNGASAPDDYYFQVSSGWIEPNSTTTGTNNFRAWNIQVNYDMTLASSWSDFGIGSINPDNCPFQAHADGSFKAAGPVGGVDEWNFTVDTHGNTDINANLSVSGNVGIGTTTPTANLDVNGNVNISGNLIVQGCIQYNCADSCETLGECI